MDEFVSDAEWQAIERAMQQISPVPVAVPTSSLSVAASSSRPASAPARVQAPLNKSPSASVTPKKLDHQPPIFLSMWDRFRFMISKYPVHLQDWLSKFPGAVFDQGLKVFHFPFVHYGRFLQEVREKNWTKIHEIPIHVIDALCNPLPPEAPFVRERIPADLWENMFPFQRDGVEFAVKHNGRCLIGDEMGLGKTIQAISVARYYKDDWPVLIVCPSSLRSAWEQQICKWLPQDAAGINMVATAKGSLEYPINIVSVSLVEKMSEALKNKAFKIIVVDECHSLKNVTTKRTKAMIPLLQKAKRCVLLSGTPAVSRPIELFPILNAIRPVVFANMKNFGTRYCDAKMLPWGMSYQGASNTRELNALLSLVMIRRKKDDVLTQLPAKIRQKVLLHVGKNEMEAINRQNTDRVAVNEVLYGGAADRDTMREATFLKHALFFEMFRNTGRAKLPAVCEYVLECLGDEETGQKFLVFAHHKDVIDGICLALDQKKKPHIRIDGSTPSKQRQPLVDVFQTDPTIRVAVLSITAAGVGLTLTAASNVFFAELFYNPGALMQAEDRAHRIGQMDTVHVQYLVARNTIDEQLFRILNSKISVLGETLDGVCGRKFDVGSEAKDRENVLAFQEDSFLTEVLNMVKGAGGYNCEDEDDEEGDDEVEGGELEGLPKKVRRDENEEIDVDSAMKQVEQMRQANASSSASKFAAFSFKK